MARLIPAKVPANQNRSEAIVREFLSHLPEDCIVYQELRLSLENFRRSNKNIQKRPDFVVVSPEFGLVSIEVKDWNLDRNRYEWQDQETVIKREPDGNVEEMRNPFAQAEDYLYALKDIMRADKLEQIRVSSFVIFPFITETKFQDKISRPEVLKKSAGKGLFDLSKVLFQNELDERNREPAYCLRQKIQQRPKAYDEKLIYRVHSALIPQDFVIGDITRKQREREQLRMITREQEEWIRNLDRKANYLLDVAGSGKTNSLISKAIFLTKQALEAKQEPVKILLSSYSTTLTNNMRAIYEGKTTVKERQNLSPYIHIISFPQLMEEIAAQKEDVAPQEYRKRYYSGNSEEYRDIILSDAAKAIDQNPQKYHEYGQIFIDEIQDFDDRELQLLLDLSANRSFFFVGDVGQRIKKASFNLNRHPSLDVHEAELPKSYQMYRTPRSIAELAHRFVTSDKTIQEEFLEYGYRHDASFKSHLMNGAELVRTENYLGDLIKRIENALASGSYQLNDILLICPDNKRDSLIRTGLEKAGIATQRGYENKPDRLTIVDFVDAKGLEYELVLVADIESLPHRDTMRFETMDKRLYEEMIARRKIYIALTRCLEECAIYYQNNSHPFIAELLSINQRLQQNRRKDLF